MSGLPTLVVGAGLALLSASCTKLEAQTAAPAEATPCKAYVVAVEAGKSCPIAKIDFQISVPACGHSTGTFEYDYQRISETRKVQVSKVASWQSIESHGKHSEQVPLACDEEILDVQITRASCSCRQ